MNEHDRSPYGLPLTLLSGAFVLWFGFQTVQLIVERRSLAALATSQEPTYANAQKMRDQLDALAAGVARLAARDNANATALVNALNERGISINPDAAKASSEPPK